MPITEKVQAQIIAEVDDPSLKQAGNEVDLFARDTGKKLDRAFLFKLQLDKAQTKLELENARALLRQAKKDGDKDAVLRLTLKTDQLQSKLTEAGRNLNNFVNTGQTGTSRLSRLFDGLSDKVGQLGLRLGALAIGAGFINLGKQALFLADKLEQAEISFTTMLDSAENAKLLLEDLAIFAANTPFELVGLRDTAKQLLAFGIAQDQIIPSLKALGDVSAGLSVPIQQVAYAYGQVKVAGRLMGQELMQFTNAGVPLIAELSKNLGVAQKDIKKMVSEGKIGFNDVKEAFKTMTEEGGKFANLMDKQTETLTGRWSNLQDTFNSFLEEVGTDMIPFAKGIVSAMSYALTAVQTLYYGFKISFNFIQGIVGYAVITIANQIHQMVDFFRLLPENLGIMVENIGLIFDNLPGFMARGLNKAIEKVEDFINFVGKGVKKLGKVLGIDTSGLSDVYLGRVGGDANLPALKEFKTGLGFELKDSGAKYFRAQMDDIMDIVEKGSQRKKDLNTELVIDEEETQDKLTGAGKGGASQREKDAKEAEKKEKDRREKYQKWLEEQEEKRIKAEEERQKKIKEGIGIIQDYYGEVRDQVDESMDKLDDFDEKIKESRDKIKDLKKDLAEETKDAGLELAERRLEVLEKMKELEKENVGIDRVAKRTSAKTLESIGEGDLGFGITGNIALEYKKLQDELAFIESQGNIVTEDIKEQASETESERIVRELNEKTAAIQEEIEAEKEKLRDLKKQKADERLVYEELNAYRTTLEENFTKVLENEVQKRIGVLEAMRVKAMETANALVEAGITKDASNVSPYLSPSTNTTTNNIEIKVEGGNASAEEIANTVYNRLQEETDAGEKGFYNK